MNIPLNKNAFDDESLQSTIEFSSNAAFTAHG